MEEKRTKIICTIGPATSSVSMLTRLINAGMNVARLNFSHGTHPDHKKLMTHIRQAARKTDKIVGILQDLQGPKIRIGTLSEDVKLSVGQRISYNSASDEFKPGDKHLPVTYSNLHRDVKKGHRIFMDDGKLEAEVTTVRGRIISAKVVAGGMLKSHKGMNLPDSKVSTSAYTKKDHEDLMFGLENEVDWVALSFVESAAVVQKVRKIILAKCRSLGTVPPRIIVKIERRAAVENFLEILAAVDGVMFARGDLGVEIPFEEVPIIQKEFIEICRQTGKPIVVATHMMDSMVESPRATRAEVSDVANAVIDHTDAVMLSAESATGQYPVVTVKAMNTIIEETEASRLDDIGFFQLHNIPDLGTSMAHAIHVMAENDQIDFIATSSTYGDIAQKINVFRPNAPIVIACPNASVARQLTLKAGVYTTVLTDEPGTFVHRMEAKLRRMKLVKTKHRVAYVTAAPSGEIQLTIR
ncbi:MAG: pyruvate kinase [Patescibacteria group bacterium]